MGSINESLNHRSHSRNPGADEELPSDRSWGLTLGGISAAIAVWNHARVELAGAFLVIGFLLIGMALVAPKRLHPLNRKWMTLGHLLARLTNPVLMGATFLFVITPLGLLLRAFGKQFLELKKDPDAKSYWIPRQKGKIDAPRLKRLF